MILSTPALACSPNAFLNTVWVGFLHDLVPHSFTNCRSLHFSICVRIKWSDKSHKNYYLVSCYFGTGQGTRFGLVYIFLVEDLSFFCLFFFLFVQNVKDALSVTIRNKLLRLHFISETVVLHYWWFYQRLTCILLFRFW